MAKANENLLGAWAFLIGVVLAVIAGFAPSVNLTQGIWAGLFIALGIVIGLLNITAKESKDFLIAGTVMVIVSVLSGEIYKALPYIGNIIRALVVLFTPATIIVALKMVFEAGKR